MNYTLVSSPIWANPERTSINCTVTFDSIGQVPFTASSLDSVHYSREIFDRASAGEFGTVIDLIIPDVPDVPVQTLKSVKREVANSIADRRFVIETRGVTIDGFRISTDRKTQAQLSTMYSSMSTGIITSVDWKLSAETFVTMDLEAITSLFKGVSEHVQRCFSAEKVLVAKVFAATTIAKVRALESAPLEGI